MDYLAIILEAPKAKQNFKEKRNQTISKLKFSMYQGTQ